MTPGPPSRRTAGSFPAHARAHASLVTALAALALAPAPQHPLLEAWDLDGDGAARRLPRALEEISGLAVDPDGRLLAHHDETAEVFELDPETGAVVRRFAVGDRSRGDFEGLAAAGERLFLVDSDGRLLEFRAGEDGERVPYREIRTDLGRWCEVEGLAWDEATASLLMPCKTPRISELRDQLVVFAFSLARMELERPPRIRIPFVALEPVGLRRFRPAAVEVHPSTGALLLASAQDEAILELDRDGHPVAARRIDARRFPQLEGLTLGPDGSLVLASEGRGGRGRLARFPALRPASPP